MCTLIVFHRTHDSLPLVVAANRDERLDRPAAPPAVRTDGPLAVLAPKDLKDGGTWLGLNEKGVFAAITNRFGVAHDPSRRSRGLLVLDALEGTTAAGAFERLANLTPTTYNGFHLVVADRERAYLLVNDGHTVRREALDPGIHVITERSFDAAPTGREARLARELPALDWPPRNLQATLAPVLGAHGVPSFDGTCVHWDERGYGTRSSTLFAIGPTNLAQFLFAPGPPCTTAYEDLSSLAQSLLVGGGAQTPAT